METAEKSLTFEVSKVKQIPLQS